MRHFRSLFYLPRPTITRERRPINRFRSALIPNLEAPAAKARKPCPESQRRLILHGGINRISMRHHDTEVCHVPHPAPPKLSLSLSASPVYHDDLALWAAAKATGARWPISSLA